MKVPSENKSEPQASPELVQFHLKSLFVLTFLCALSVSLVVQLHLLGTIVLFVLGVAASLFLLLRVEMRRSRFWLQAIWGVVLPLAFLSLLTDPVVLVESVDDDVSNEAKLEALSIYSFFGWQTILLCASWFLTLRNSKCAAFLCGSLFAGSLFAGGMGLMLVPITILMLIFGIGLLGITPWLTMITYIHAATTCWTIARRSEKKFVQLLLGSLGFSASLAIGIGAYFSWWQL